MVPTTATDWDGVAGAWDTHVDYIEGHSTGATDALLAKVGVHPGDRVLELAAGPGTLAPVWSRLAAPEGSVVVSDVSPAMVEAARRRAEGLPNVEVAVLDLSAIERPDASFDVVACRMGLMFALDPGAALAEFGRVLRPGGRIGVLTWGTMKNNPWMTCVGMSAAMNGVIAGSTPLAPGGIFSLSHASALEVLAKEAGFVDVETEEIDTTFHAESVEAHVARVSSLAGPLAAAFAAASEEELAAVLRTSADLAAPWTSDDGSVALPGRAILLTARA
jgi:ubiquinone/menaquinone biosynthesis C-methylase UbiE